MKNQIISLLALLGAGISTALGGWDASIMNLCIVMGLDYITGLIVAGVFRKSTKTESGGLSSAVGWKGLVKKGMILILVVVANLLDKQIGSSYVRDAVCIAFICNDCISILENASLMGLPIPEKLRSAIDVLKGRSEKDD